MSAIFGDFFDLNRDGEKDLFEHSLEWRTITNMTSEQNNPYEAACIIDEDEEEDDAFFEGRDEWSLHESYSQLDGKGEESEEEIKQSIEKIEKRLISKSTNTFYSIINDTIKDNHLEMQKGYIVDLAYFCFTLLRRSFLAIYDVYNQKPAIAVLLEKADLHLLQRAISEHPEEYKEEIFDKAGKAMVYMEEPAHRHTSIENGGSMEEYIAAVTRSFFHLAHAENDEVSKSRLVEWFNTWRGGIEG